MYLLLYDLYIHLPIFCDAFAHLIFYAFQVQMSAKFTQNI